MDRAAPLTAAEVTAAPSLFRERGYAIFWSASLLSAIGSWIQNVAAALMMLRLTESAMWVGFAGFASLGPMFFFALPAGILADRKPRSKIVIRTHLIAAGSTALLSLLAFTERLNAPTLLVLVAVAGTAYAFSKPALQTLPPELVAPNRIRQAVAGTSSLFMVAQIVGPAVAGLLVGFAGIGIAFLANAASYLVVVAAMPSIRAVIRGRPDAVERREMRRAQAREADVRGYLGQHRHIVHLLVVIAFSTSITEVVRTLAPIYALDLGAGEVGAGWMISAYGGGGLLAVSTLGSSMDRRGPLKAALAGFALFAFALAGLASAHDFATALVAATAVGIGHFLSSVTLTALLQELADSGIRGRIMSLHTLSSLGLRPFAALAAGGIAAATSLRTALVAACAVALLGAVVVGGLATGADGLNRWRTTSGGPIPAPKVP